MYRTYPQEGNQFRLFKQSSLGIRELRPSLLKRTNLVTSDSLRSTGGLENVGEVLYHDSSKHVQEYILLMMAIRKEMHDN